LPEKSMAPPTSVNFGKSMPPRAVLLAIWKAPPTLVRESIVMLARFALASIANDPLPVLKLPTVVKFGALRLVM